MNHEELLQELELLVAAMEESLAVVTGTFARQIGPVETLKNLVSAEQALLTLHGPNEWRDRLLRSAKRNVAIQARPLSQDDPVLQSLISTVLAGRKDSDPQH